MKKPSVIKECTETLSGDLWKFFIELDETVEKTDIKKHIQPVIDAALYQFPYLDAEINGSTITLIGTAVNERSAGFLQSAASQIVKEIEDMV